jgi:RNA polymerase subunit RPABC4/transcription elongation factor Spt4
MNFDLSSMNSYVLIATAFAAAFLATLWVSLIIWTIRDVRRRSKDPMARILAVLIVALLFLPGMLIYAILRPARTLDEEFQQSLEEEALLQTIEDIPLCPGCSRKVHMDWIVCPNCHTKLKKKCHHCKSLMELPWNICPYCSTTVPGMRKENVMVEDFLPPLTPTLFENFDEPEQTTEDS